MGKDHWINCGVTDKAKDSKMTVFEDAMKDILDYNPNGKVPAKTIVLPPASRSHRETDYNLDNAFFDLVEKDLDLRSFGGDWTNKGNGNAAMTQLWVGSGQVNGN